MTETRSVKHPPASDSSSSHTLNNSSSTSPATYFDVLFRVLQVLKQRVFAPGDSTLLVGGGIGVSIGLSGLTTKKAVQIRSLLVRSALLDRVALRALGLENLGSLLLAHGCC